MTTGPAIRLVAHLWRHSAEALLWFLAVVAAIFVGLGLIIAMTDGVDGSVWEFAGAGALKYLPLAIGVMLTTSLLPTYVAHGVTRHQFTIGGSLYSATLALAAALVMVVGYGVEALAFRVGDVPHGLALPHLYDSAGEVGVVLLEYFPIVFAHIAAGSIIGTTYYRLGWLPATLLLPVTFAPALLADQLLATSWMGETGPMAGAVPVAVAVPGALVGLLTVAANYAATRSMAIKIKSA